MPRDPKKILAVVSDLLFTVKINEAAKRLGMTVEYVKDPDAFREKARELPTLIIVDLNLEQASPLEVVSELKGNPETKRVSVIGYVSHVQGDLKQAAQDAGYNMVLARSAFSTNLPQILKRHATTL